MREPSTRTSIVVTGAAGYIGSHVVRAVADLGFVPVAVVRPGRGSGVDPRARIVEADLLSPDFDVREVVDDNTAAFIHLAWQDGFVHNSPAHMAHLSAHFSLLTAVAAAGVPRLSVLGTMHEVGYWEGAIDADTPTDPRSLYGIAKDALRRALPLVVPESTELSWLRCYYIYGDDRRSNSIFGKILKAVDAGQTTMPFVTGKSLHDFIDVDVLADQIAAVATTPGVTGVINCCSGEPISLADQVEAFIADHQLPIRLEYGVFPERPYDSPGVWGDATRIRNVMAALSR
ncbi:NAD-dependent epimerase/dehydratase [Microbacterium laevaniformans OR221]|nr:NAD-dependent epimerase/dehydratase [Microbacterium laevaniformans OR221]